MDDTQFARLLDFFNYSWKGYRKVRKGVKKRVARHMQALGCRDMNAYLEIIDSEDAVRAECVRRMTVSISRFFRDRYLWQIIENRVLPKLMGTQRPPVRVWFAGCAGGEEVYSFRILWEEAMTGCAIVPALDVIATDLNPENLHRAKKGIYPKSTMREVDDGRLQRWFEQSGKDRYGIDPELARGISWQVQDLLTTDPPGNNLDVIFLRNNLLTYYQQERIEKPLERMIDALLPTGFMIIGAREKMPPKSEIRLTLFDRYVYRKKAG